MVDMISLLGIGMHDVRFVGIWGMGGSGKSTLARVVYENISSEFEKSCFLANVREVCERVDQVHLQRELLSHLSISGMVITDKYEGKIIIRNCLCNKKVLLVLDDVNNVSQLENLVESPKWFGIGSRVIITTRDKHLLTSSGVCRIYEMETMMEDESLQLFSRKAFKNSHPEDDYLVLSKSVVKYAGGLPLALDVLGSFLCGRSVPEWEDALDRLKQFPDDSILQILKTSYDALNDEEKTMFLDIACFFKGERKDEVIQIFQNCDLHPTIGINILMEKALLVEKKDWYGECILEMHDLLQELGRNIVFQESPSNAGRQSRLWKLDDIREVLKNNTGSEAVQAIVVYTSPHNIEIHPDAFSKMSNLRLLILPMWVKHSSGLKCLPLAIKVVQWYSFSLESLPLEISLDKLVEIKMDCSKIKQLWNGILFMKKLKIIDMRNSKDLVKTPDFSGVPNLEKLILDGCSSLVVVHPSLGELKKLVEVNLRWCTSLEILPRKLEMSSLIKLNLYFCYRVSVLPEFGESMKKLSSLDLTYTAITNLPESLGFLTGLRDLKLTGCMSLGLDITGCSEGFKMPKHLNEDEALREHDISETFKTETTPINIAHLGNNKELNMSTWSFRHIFGLNLTSLSELDLSYCGINDGSLPNDFGGLPSLVALSLECNDFVNMPSGCFSKLFHLRYLFLDSCKRLKSLPNLPSRLIRIDAINCDSLESLSDGQLWILVSSLDHEYRRRTKYLNKLLAHIESEYLPQKDFVAIIPGVEIPSWFPNKDGSHSHDAVGLENVFITVDIPLHLRACEWSGIAICLSIPSVSTLTRTAISWSSKAPEDDSYKTREWAHLIVMDRTQCTHLCIMVLHLNEKTCWHHLRGDNNSLHIKLRAYGKLGIRAWGWRVLCKQEMEKWCNINYFSNSSEAEVGTSEVCLPHSALFRTIREYRGGVRCWMAFPN